ncbi:pyridoxal phosphate-dependent aminotransferase [Bryobacter aggregatus]|uniref:pyridoxal phosphate-dependent aminotransferase n=1 Tax=Bryobacter aggregatus TaxID=360054 RepID=UPI0004E11CDF|nr:pyridoxal phosphate-dependent aminotransferase [Bryobacter aggregatus]
MGAPQIAPIAASVPYSRVRAIAELAMTMEHVYPLYFGESNLPTPEFIKRALDRAVRDGFTYYTSNAGLLSLREALARYYVDKHGVSLDPATELLVTASGVQALSVGIRCLVDPGDEALVLTPAWPNGASIVSLIGAKAVEIAQPLAGSRFTIDFEALEAALTPKTKLLIYTSPSNPLGWVATVAEQQRLLDFARKYSLWLLADEVYERLTYTVPIAPSILKLATREDAVLVVQSFSKAYCMTGWRLGWIAGRRDLVKRATELNEFHVSCPAGFTQRAAQAALEWGEDFVSQIRMQLKANRDYCLGMLQDLPGVSIPEAEGAFYLFPKLAGLTDSFEFAKQCLLETHVGIAPGVAFGQGGEGSIRICYAADRSVLEPAMERLASYISKRPR